MTDIFVWFSLSKYPSLERSSSAYLSQSRGNVIDVNSKQRQKSSFIFLYCVVTPMLLAVAVDVLYVTAIIFITDRGCWLQLFVTHMPAYGVPDQ